MASKPETTEPASDAAFEPNFVQAGPLAAYEIAVDVTDQATADELGLIVVESTPTGGPAAWGRYKA